MKLLPLPLVMFPVAALMTGCSNLWTSDVRVSYAPPLIPVTVEYSTRTQTLDVSAHESVVTPIGMFAVSAVAEMQGRARADQKKLLVVKIGNMAHYYELDGTNAYSIKLPSSE